MIHKYLHFYNKECSHKLIVVYIINAPVHVENRTINYKGYINASA